MIRVANPGRRAAIMASALALSAAYARYAGAQGGVLLQGIVDVEGWSTNTTSQLLTRNQGKPGDVIRGQLWGAVEPWRGVFVFAQGRAEGGSARPYDERYTESALDQAGLRFARDPRFVINVGKMPHPLSTFAPRLFSTRNPLIGTPDGYSPVYPLGAMLSGEIGRMDYRAAVISLPLTHVNYQPSADAAARPLVGIAYTPVVGFRVGVGATVGPYLNGDLTSSQLMGQSWKSYHQRLLTTDVEYGVHHFDFRGEYALSSYDVPGNAAISGETGYVEGRYTVSPRVFVAARGEVNNYPFIRPISQTLWVSKRTDFRDWETGVGFRATESTLLKISYRGDKWPAPASNPGFARPAGRAFAVQLSQSFDVMDWVTKVR